MLVIRLKQGNDESIKKHLSGRLKEATEKIENLSSFLSNTEEAYQKAASTNEQLMGDLSMLREENRRLADQFRIEEQKKLNELKEKMLLEQSELQGRHDQEKKENALKYEKDTGALNDKLSALQAAHESLQNQKREADSNIRDLN